MSNKSEQRGRPVVLTTTHRGVFFGYAKDTSGTTIHLKEARMCVRWSPDMKGVIGLAVNGPSASCRIGPAAISAEVRDVVCILEVTEQAQERWEKAPWAS